MEISYNNQAEIRIFDTAEGGIFWQLKFSKNN